MWSRVAVGSTGSGDVLGLNIDPVTNISIKAKKDKTLSLKWQDPEDKVVTDGEVAAKWAGTKVVYKQGSFPVNRFDGIQVLDSKVRNQYKDKEFEITGLTNGTTYYIAFFPYTDTELYNNDVSQRIEGTPVEPPPYKVYSLIIDEANSNPETACTYDGDSIGMTPGDAKWDETPIFKNIKPCVLKNGKVQYYLNPNDFSLKEDGSPSKLDGTDGDVMIEFPKMGYKIENLGDQVTDKRIKVSLTEDTNNINFCYLPFSRDAIGDCHHIYIGAYFGYVQDGKLRSISDVVPYTDASYEDFRSYCRDNGVGYEMYNFYPHVLLQCLFLMRYKNRDSQQALGEGWTNTALRATTGGTNKKGMNFGDTFVSQMKFCGIEDWWGNLYCFMDGLYVDENKQLIGAWRDFYYNWNTPKKIETKLPSSESGYLKETSGISENGFLPAVTKGSSSTYYPDSWHGGYTNRVSAVGGSESSRYEAGAFYCNAYLNVFYLHKSYSTRLVYRDNK